MNIQISWCELEAIVSDPRDINPSSETDPEVPKEVLPLTVRSLNGALPYAYAGHTVK